VKAAVKQRRGFALMSPDRLRDVSASGGRRAHELGRAHEWTKREARSAGVIGGKVRGDQMHAAWVKRLAHFGKTGR
jgi:hypothetical protein